MLNYRCRMMTRDSGITGMNFRDSIMTRMAGSQRYESRHMPT